MTVPGRRWAAALQSRRRMAALAIVVSLLVVAGIVWLLTRLHPLPPRTITMATGPEGSAYVEFGRRYRELLSREGIDLRLRPTAGAVENLALLRDPESEVQIAFVSGGLTSRTASPGLSSLGTVAYEPLWLFTRGEAAGQDLRGLQARRLSIGREGSATRALSLQLLKLNAENPRFIDLQGLTPEQEGEELVQGRIDAALMLTAWDSPVVRRLIVADSIDLVSFPRADAYVALFPYLTKLVVPMGVGDLARERPPRDVTLLATRTSLVARSGLHPALQYLLLEVAAQVHSGAEIFQKPGEFPAAESIDLPLSTHAQHYYKSGRPFLQRYVPFWLAVMGEQILVIAIPIAGILYPLASGLMALYGWGMRRRIVRIYGELLWIESEIAKRGAGLAKDDLSERLQALEKRTSGVQLPPTYVPLLYTLKEHLYHARARLERSRTSPES